MLTESVYEQVSDGHQLVVLDGVHEIRDYRRCGLLVLRICERVRAASGVSIFKRAIMFP